LRTGVAVGSSAAPRAPRFPLLLVLGGLALQVAEFALAFRVMRAGW